MTTLEILTLELELLFYHHSHSRYLWKSYSWLQIFRAWTVVKITGPSPIYTVLRVAWYALCFNIFLIALFIVLLGTDLPIYPSTRPNRSY